MYNRYSFSEIVKNIYSLVMTKLMFRQARFVRRPIYIRGRRSMSGAKGLTTGRFCRFDLPGNRKTLFIGDNVEMGDMTHIVALNNVTIGNNVLIASKCFISDTNHGNYTGEKHSSADIPPRKRELKSGETRIGNNVWVGENVVILAGAKIGDGCIIGANSVITKEIPKECIVVGNNKIIKQFNRNKGIWEHV